MKTTILRSFRHLAHNLSWRLRLMILDRSDHAPEARKVRYGQMDDDGTKPEARDGGACEGRILQVIYEVDRLIVHSQAKAGKPAMPWSTIGCMTAGVAVMNRTDLLVVA